MIRTTTTPCEFAEHLCIPEERASYLETCPEEANGDTAFLAKALGEIAQAKGITQAARDAGFPHESLYKALSGARSSGFDLILKVIVTLGRKLHAKACLTG